MNKKVKLAWDTFTDNFGHTVLHPQYTIIRYNIKHLKFSLKLIKGTLIDIGCGRMPYRRFIEPHVTKYIGLDHPITSKLYKNGKYTPDIYSDAKNIPVKNKSFDTALMLEVLEHFSQPLHILSEVHRILKSGGYVVLTVPFMYPIHDPGHDYARYTETMIKNMLHTAGFQRITIEPKGTFLEFLGLSIILYVLDRLKKLPMVIAILLILPVYVFSVGFNVVIMALTPLYTFVPKASNNFVLSYCVTAQA